uniref:Rhodanese domain-containing protein n=2 Tax=Clytia hemisphaerica TaxID=252671 RepID=A0A7M5V7M9_9CNID
MASRGGKTKKPTTYLGKTNKKFEHVKAVVDTGSSVSNYMSKIEDLRKNYRFRKDELFKRMKISTFSQLVLQVAEVVNLEMERISELDENSPRSLLPEQEEQTDGGGGTDRSCLLDVIRGVGELSTSGNNNNNNNDTVESEEKEEQHHREIVAPDPLSLPYLLLDIRDSDAFDEGHIIGAINYPSAMLNRTVNYLSKEICAFKNKPGKIIIVYDDDEKLAPQVATSLLQKDVENVIMLSGGMKVLHKKFPSCFITGTVPSTCFSPKTDRKGKLKPPPKVISNIGVEWYTPELLESIQEHLDEVLLSNESSRMSSRTTTRNSKVSSARSSAPSTASSYR